MNYSEFAKPFYCKTKVLAGIRGKTSQSDVGAFFLETALGGKIKEKFIYSQDAYRKWFTGENTPGNSYWEEIEKEFDEEKFSDAIASKINDSVFTRLFDAFEIQLSQGIQPDKHILANALTVQFKAIVEGRGEADNLVSKAYFEYIRPSKFSIYIQKAADRYKMMTLFGEQDCLLDDFYVCNFISTRPGVFAYRVQPRNTIIEDATLDKIKNFDTRGINKNTILLGSGGIGKTLMLQHLFIEAVGHYSERGLFPVLLELRDFSYNNNDLLSSIVKSVQHFESSFKEEDAEQLMTAGKCQLLLDGIDEIDPSDMPEFQRKLSEMLAHYPDNQIILASRDCDAIKGIRGFVKLYLLPFNNDQSLKLIDKLLENNSDYEQVKNKILEYMEKGFIKKDGVFASNPMLLTFIVMKYPMLESFYGSHYKFYKAVYDAVVSGHDKAKTAYDRIFHSVCDSEEFTKIFREFCAETYSQGVFEFNQATFEKHFNELSLVKELENPHKMKKKSFLHDVCATACMMYEQDLDILYIDPGFQEFLFAEYCYQVTSDKIKEMGRFLWNIPLGQFEGDNAFEMLYDLSPEKMEVCLFIPYLDTIFRGKSSDDEALVQFLVNGYDTLQYSFIDTDLIEKYEQAFNIVSQSIISSINEPTTIILSLIIKKIGEPDTFLVTTDNEKAKYDACAVIAMTGEVVYDTENQEERLYMRRNPQNEFVDKSSFERNHSVERCIRDENGEIVCFGHEYEIELCNLQDEPEKYNELLQLLKDENSDIWKTYIRVKEYYEQIKKKQKINAFR